MGEAEGGGENADATVKKEDTQAEACDQKAPKEEEEEKGEVKKEEEKKEEEDCDEPRPVAVLTEEESKRYFRKKSVPDLTTWVLGTNFTKFTVPDKDEGFDEIQCEWDDLDESKD